MHAQSDELDLKTELFGIVEVPATNLEQTSFKSLQLGEMNVSHGPSVDFKVAWSRDLHSFPCFGKFLYLGR